MLAWRLRLLEESIPPRATGLVRHQGRMSLVQAAVWKETTFGRTLSQKIWRYRGMSLSILQR